MKPMMILAALALGAGLSPPALAVQRTVVLSVPSMNCAACPITVRKALEKISGVQTVKSVEQLTEATKNAGYPSSVRSQR